jgi:hypothetical protein
MIVSFVFEDIDLPTNIESEDQYHFVSSAKFASVVSVAVI